MTRQATDAYIETQFIMACEQPTRQFRYRLTEYQSYLLWRKMGGIGKRSWRRKRHKLSKTEFA